MLNIFKKKKDGGQKKEEKKIVQNEIQPEEVKPAKEIIAIPGAYGVLRGFYVSEKSSMLAPFNQYVFKVSKQATKNEVAEKVEKFFNVKVKKVKVLNIPRKKRRLGRHSGYKTGFRKAIVVLEKGQIIEEARV